MLMNLVEGEIGLNNSLWISCIWEFLTTMKLANSSLFSGSYLLLYKWVLYVALEEK